METEIVREYVTLAKELNYTSSAKILHTTQPTLSRHMLSLEAELGTQLLDRSTTGVELTKAGRIFLEGAVDLLGEMDSLVALTRRAGKVPAQKVRIGGNLKDEQVMQLADACSIYATRKSVPLEITLYEPHMASSHEELMSHDLVETLRRGDVDLLLFLAREDFEWGDLQHIALGRSPVAVLVSENHELTRREDLELRDLESYPFVRMPMHGGFGDGVLSMCREAGFSPRFRTRVFESQNDMLTAHDDKEIIIVPQSIADHMPPRSISGLARLALKEELYMGIWAVYLAEHAMAVDRLVELLKAVAPKIESER